MGGNAFPRLDLRRVQRDQLVPTVEFLVNKLSYPGFTFEYAMDNLMGSAGKQADSGDLDFALNNLPARFVGQPDLPVFSLKDFSRRCREVLPNEQMSTKTLNGGQIQTAWPLCGDPANGYAQCDFLSGDPEWLKFSHWSPGKDHSPWKGVFISTMYGVLAKRLKDFEAFVDDDPEGVRLVRVGWHFDLERGLHRKWKMQKRVGQGVAEVSPDEVETRFPDCPRLPRLGYLTNPTVVLSVLFESHTEHSEVDTFEKVVLKLRSRFPDEFEDLKTRFLEALMRSAARNEYTLEQMEDAFATS
jgi:hypothetical protein